MIIYKNILKKQHGIYQYIYHKRNKQTVKDVREYFYFSKICEYFYLAVRNAWEVGIWSSRNLVYLFSADYPSWSQPENILLNTDTLSNLAHV